MNKKQGTGDIIEGYDGFIGAEDIGRDIVKNGRTGTGDGITGMGDG